MGRSAPDRNGNKPSLGETAGEEDWTDISGVASLYMIHGVMMKKFLDSLSKAAWETSCARYNSSRRLKVREIFSTISLALIGLSGIALTLIQYFWGAGLNPNFNIFITAFSIILSMLLIIISLIEWGFASGAKSEALFRNAELLNEHERKISLFKSSLKEEIAEDDYKKIDNLRDEYEKIKSTCVFNHSPIDYEYHKIIKNRYYITHTSESFSFWRILKGRVAYSISSIWGYLFIWLVVVMFFFKVALVIIHL